MIWKFMEWARVSVIFEKCNDKLLMFPISDNDCDFESYNGVYLIYIEYINNHTIDGLYVKSTIWHDSILW